MKMLNPKAIALSISMLLLCLHSYAEDTNANVGSECSEPDNSTSENTFQTNLNNLLNSLASIAPLHNGFYKAKTSNTNIYGLVQCRADVSAQDCNKCIKQSAAVALHDCPKSKRVRIWSTWCFLRYSDEDFFGVWDPSTATIANDTDLDDPSVVLRGFNLMTQLASTAPEQPLMFETVVLDVGKNGKRYGMAQCIRDISRSNCRKCLDGSLMAFKTTIEDKRGWEIYGSSCSLWYNDFQFYSNISISASQGVRRFSPSPMVAVLGLIVAASLLITTLI